MKNFKHIGYFTHLKRTMPLWLQFVYKYAYDKKIDVKKELFVNKCFNKISSCELAFYIFADEVSQNISIRKSKWLNQSYEEKNYSKANSHLFTMVLRKPLCDLKV